METVERSALKKAITFSRFALQQRKVRKVRLAEITPIGPSDVILDGSETSWSPTGFQATKGRRFSVRASGANIIDKRLALFVQPKFSLWIRIGGKAPIHKVLFDEETVFEAWADGTVEAFAKGLSLWADDAGTVMPGPRKRFGDGIGVLVSATDRPVTKPDLPENWKFMPLFGAVNIFSGDSNDITVRTSEGDCCILQTDVDVALNDQTVAAWSWLVEKLPSDLPEDLALTHDYISVAFEFDNGRDLTYMWSRELPAGYHFHCPLPWWCQRETHWIVRSGTNDLGTWQEEKRRLLYDYQKAIPGTPPSRITGIWLIANSVFQRREGRARFRDIRIEDLGGGTLANAGSYLKCTST
ncbi:hypothetical protein NJLHNGOC_06590 [Novacetimonas cocois]|uniref:DUF3047 domain-containing protein n=1 Tax=Novacetimonas cocois TaxID=1747507 RepID=A0A365YZ23_9PROT|nr:hypothetical protein NJLHNGOC_06590 [Novacetimonas cocois]